MADNRKLTFFHSPNSRSTGVFILLEELAIPYEMKLLNMKAGENRAAEYLAINPMGKVPAIVHGDALVTEQGAIYIYLADTFSSGNLAPSLEDPLRGPYLRWMVFYGSCFEPAAVDRAMKRDAAPLAMSPYGDFDTTMKTICDQLKRGPWLLGERFSVADILWGMALGWMTKFKIVPETPEVMDYIARFDTRPSVAKVNAADTKYRAEHEAIAKAASPG